MTANSFGVIRYTQSTDMADLKFKPESNPLLIPKAAPKPRTCPKCGSGDYTGRRIQGTVLFRCKKPECGAEFGGGMAPDPIDPTKPMPPTDPNDRPLVEFVESRHQDARDGYREVRRRPSTVQPFRTGAPIPQEED